MGALTPMHDRVRSNQWAWSPFPGR